MIFESEMESKDVNLDYNNFSQQNPNLHQKSNKFQRTKEEGK